MGKEVKNRISLDASRFERGTALVKRNIKDLEKGLTVDMKTAAKLGGAAILAVGAAIIGIGGAVAVGVKGVIDLGGRMSDLSAQTGVAVSDLLILEQAFNDNGVSSENARLGINKLQKNLSEARGGSKTAIKAFSDLGVSLDALSRMSPEDQFVAIGNAISEIQDPADKAAAAMGIFGKSGAEMLAVFGQGKIEDAAASLGSQSFILEKNAALFDRAGDLLGRAGLKAQGFFIGIADKVVPVVLPLLEAFDKLDLASQGQAFGESISTGLRALIGAFQNNQLGELIWISMKEVGLNFVSLVARGWIGIASGFYQALEAGRKIFIATVFDGFIGIAKAFSAAILEAVGAGLALVPGMGGVSEKVMGSAGDLAKDSVSRIGLALTRIVGIPAALQEALEGGMADLDGWSLFDTSDLAAQRKAIVDSALAAVPAIGAAAAELLNPVKRKPFEIPESTGGPVVGGVSSLAAIGGGGGVEGMGGVESLVNESQRQTGYLRSISGSIKSVEGTIKSLGNVGGTRDAVFA